MALKSLGWFTFRREPRSLQSVALRAPGCPLGRTPRVVGKGDPVHSLRLFSRTHRAVWDAKRVNPAVPMTTYSRILPKGNPPVLPGLLVIVRTKTEAPKTLKGPLHACLNGVTNFSPTLRAPGLSRRAPKSLRRFAYLRELRVAPDLSIHHPRRALEECDGAQSGSAMPVSFVLHVGCPGPLGVVPAALRGSSQSPLHGGSCLPAGVLTASAFSPGLSGKSPLLQVPVFFWTSTGWTVSLGLFSPTSCLATVAFFFNYLRGVRSAFLCTLLV
jgi:hypothetical protein